MNAFWWTLAIQYLLAKISAISDIIIYLIKNITILHLILTCTFSDVIKFHHLAFYFYIFLVRNSYISSGIMCHECFLRDFANPIPNGEFTEMYSLDLISLLSNFIMYLIRMCQKIILQQNVIC